MFDTEAIVQAGAVGIALALSFVLYKKDQGTQKIVGNHLKSETDAKVKQTKALQRLADVIQHYFVNQKKK